jgi:hypothetical protein
MKIALSIVLFLVSFAVTAQKRLREVEEFPVILSSGEGIIYGSFFDKIGYNTYGFPQGITILNHETNKKFNFIARAPFTTRKESRFIYYIKAGSYSILNYAWTESKVYGGKTRIEEVYNLKIDTNSLKTNRYTFNVEAGKVTYLGAWHFETSSVSYNDDKIQIDSTFQRKYKKINFSEAKTDLPK